MSGVMRTALGRLRPASELLASQRATYYTYGPPRYRKPLQQKAAIFAVMATVMSAPMLICVKMVPIWRSPKDE